MPTRSRQLLVYGKTGVYEHRDALSQALLSSWNVACNFVDYQRTSSISHPWKRYGKRSEKNVNIRRIADMGGPFDTRRITCVPCPVDVELSRVTGGTVRSYKGPVFAYYSNYIGQNGNIQNPSSDAVLDALGSTAISNTIPTNPLSGIGQFAAELRQLPTTSKVAQWAGQAAQLKSLKRMKKSDLLKRGSDDWLNFWFGWVPFAKDVKDFFDTAVHADKHINQLVRDSGRGVRRRYNFPDEVTTTVTNMGNGYGAPALDSYLYVAPGKLTKTVITRKRRWFSGSYTYYLPEDLNGRNEAILHHLYGLRLDMDLLWKIAPWTWAADWVTNFGDVVRNVTAFSHDGLVMRYGYMMETTTVLTEYALVGLHLHGQEPINLTQSFVTMTKKRRKATPYGFGFDPGTFTARQWSIIAALGISKAPRSLNF